MRSRYTEPTIATREQLEKQTRYHQKHRDDIVKKPTNKITSLGNIKIYAPEVLSTLGTSNDSDTIVHSESKECVIDESFASLNNTIRSPHRSAKKAGHGRTASMIDLLWQEVQQASVSNTRSVRDAVDRNDRANQLRIRRDCELIQRGNESFIESNRSYLALNENQQQERRAAVYEHWMKNVFIPIQQQVNSHVDANHKQLHQFRQALFDHYLHEPNTSVAFALSSKHQPGSPPAPQPNAPTTFAYVTSNVDLNDPTFTTLRLQQRETNSFSHSLPVANHADRTMFTPLMWSKLEATPIGRYNGDPTALSSSQLEQIERGVRVRMAELGFDHYEDPVDQPEMKGKRIVRSIKSAGHNIINNLE